jgi:hypothetical protein
MAEPLAIPGSPRRGGVDRAGPRVTHPRRQARSGPAASREWLRSSPVLTVSEARRAGNREHIGLVAELRCECARPNCRDTVPAVAETHRGIAERFVVMPDHFDGGVVVRAADRFFVVDPGSHAFSEEQGGLR